MDDPDDTGPSPVVARADALMQRRRQVIGLRPVGLEDLPVLTDLAEDDPDADLPILDDIAAGNQTLPLPAPPPPLTAAPLAEDLARHLQATLTAALPDLVASALDQAMNGLAATLEQEILRATDTAVRAFLSQRKSTSPDHQEP